MTGPHRPSRALDLRRGRYCWRICLASRHVIIVGLSAISLHPGRIGLHAQPLGGCRCQGIQGDPQRLGDTFKTIEGADGAKHMREVSALPALGAQQLLFPAQRQEGVEQMLFGASCHETAASSAPTHSPAVSFPTQVQKVRSPSSSCSSDPCTAWPSSTPCANTCCSPRNNHTRCG